MARGKSKSNDNPNGVRMSTKQGILLAPKSLRNKKTFLSECNEKELEDAKITK
jgi:hypothetical protein